MAAVCGPRAPLNGTCTHSVAQQLSTMPAWLYKDAHPTVPADPWRYGSHDFNAYNWDHSDLVDASCADMGGYVRDSVDDIMDASEQAYKELQFSEAMGTWIYKFNQALLRESVLARHTGEEAQETARRVATFMERFLAPRGHGYVVKTLRMYAENGAPQRAAILRGMAIAGDQPTLWAMTQDLLMYFDELTWPCLLYTSPSPRDS